MAKYILGLEIGHSNIKILECRQKGGKIIIQKAQRIPTPKGTILDGIINDVQQISDAINTEIKNKKYRSKNVVFVIKSSEIITRDIMMRAMPKKDMDAILSLEYQEHLLVDISQYQVTYKVLKEVIEGDDNQQEIQIVAAPNTIILPLLAVADKLKMRVRAINITSDAITNIFSTQNEMAVTNEDDIMVIDIGGKSTTVTIVSEGKGILNRDIPFGLDSINELLVKEFGSSDPKIIEEFKIKYAGIYEEGAEVDIYSQHISSILAPMVEYQLIAGIRRFLQFHFSRSKDNKIDKIYIIGGGAYLKNIDKYMAHVLGIPCLLGVELNPNKVKFPAEFLEEGAYFINTLGLISDSRRW